MTSVLSSRLAPRCDATARDTLNTGCPRGQLCVQRAQGCARHALPLTARLGIRVPHFLPQIQAFRTWLPMAGLLPLGSGRLSRH